MAAEAVAVAVEVHDVAHPVATVADARIAATELLQHGPDVVALAVPGVGDLVVWRDGEVLLPLAAEVVDPTGAGDACVVGLTAALRAGRDVLGATSVAAAASRASVGRLGGRPDLDPAVLRAP